MSERERLTDRLKRAYKPRDPRLTSEIMAAVRGRDNKADLALRGELWRRGRRYRLYDKSLPGTPDIVFRGKRLAVFVDGDYWHGRTLLERGPEALALSFHETKREYWVAKITRNVHRDQRANTLLEQNGWRVLRLWERDVLRDVAAAADIVERGLDE